MCLTIPMNFFQVFYTDKPSQFLLLFPSLVSPCLDPVLEDGVLDCEAKDGDVGEVVRIHQTSHQL
jgi:hypothetical protein